MHENRLISLQTTIGFLTLVLVLVSALALGANRPVAWSLLTFAVIPLFGLQVLRAVVIPLPHQLRGLLVPSVLYLIVLIWAIFQLSPNAPAAWLHPFWQMVPEAQGAISADPALGRQSIVRLALYAMIFVIAATTFARPDAAQWGLRVFAIWSSLLALFGFYAMATGSNPIVTTATGDIMRASFVNRNSYATYAAFGTVANIGVYLSMVEQGSLSSARRRWRNMLESFFGGGWIFGVGALLCLAAVALTASRAGALSAVVGLMTFAWAWTSKRRSEDDKRTIGSGIIFLVGLAVIVGFVAYASSGTLISRLLTASGEELRFIVFPQIIDLTLERPLLGHGLGSFQSVFRQAVPPVAGFAEWDFAHNSYLENAFELGLPASGAFYLALALIGVRILRGVRIRRRDRVYCCVAMSCFAIAMVHASFDFSLQMPATAGVFAVLCGLGWSQSFSELARRKAMIAD